MKALVFLLALLPLGRLFLLGFNDGLGANPIEFITRSTGTWALVFLCLTLAMSPLRWITNMPAWIRYRRMLGLFSFVYAVIHFGIWLWLDQNFDLVDMFKDVLKRPFITMGFLSFVLLIPLALTSNRWSQQQLGRRWKTLHRLVYILAITAILHYWWHKGAKNDLAEVSIYASIIFLLLSCRLPFVSKRLQMIFNTK